MSKTDRIRNFIGVIIGFPILFILAGIYEMQMRRFNRETEKKWRKWRRENEGNY